MHTVNLLRHLVENYQVLVYLVIFLGLIIEGELVLVSTGIFLHLGALNLYLASSVILLGLLSKTFLGYYLGVMIHRRWHKARFVDYIEKRVSSVLPHFKEKPFWSIFISKFIMGVNNIVIIFSGYHRVDFPKYLKAEMFASLVWAPVLVALGSVFSFTAINFSREIWRFSSIVFFLVVLFIILDRLVSWGYELFEEFYHDAK